MASEDRRACGCSYRGQWPGPDTALVNDSKGTSKLCASPIESVRNDVSLLRGGHLIRETLENDSFGRRGFVITEDRVPKVTISGEQKHMGCHGEAQYSEVIHTRDLLYNREDIMPIGA